MNESYFRRARMRERVRYWSLWAFIVVSISLFLAGVGMMIYTDLHRPPHCVGDKAGGKS